jgi:hypothetical protein
MSVVIIKKEGRTAHYIKKERHNHGKDSLQRESVERIHFNC